MTKKVPKQERIDIIVQAALAVFRECGYEGATMEAIARRAGVSKGGVYHHFQSKDEILLYANQKLSEPVAILMENANRRRTASDALSWYIRSYLKYWAGRQRELSFFFLSLTKMLDTPALWQLYGDYTKANIAFFKDLFERGIAAGEFIPHAAEGSSLALMSALDGVLGYLVMEPSLNVDTVISLFQERFVGAVSARKAKRRLRRASDE